MAAEDFSFPTIGDAFLCSIDSPPLWRLSPAASPNSGHDEPRGGAAREEEDDDKEHGFAPTSVEKNRRKSFSHVEDCGEASNDDEEGKMDLLWEDFNEELSSTSRSTSRGMEELSCVQALTASKNHGGALARRKPGMVVIMKVLKKLFLLQSSHRKLKIKSSSSHQELKFSYT